jgi:4-hydroxy-3-polyprenylbenzoate decarboxylase
MARPKTIEEMVDHSVGRVCDLFGLEAGLVKRWQSPPLSPLPPNPQPRRRGDRRELRIF